MPKDIVLVMKGCGACEDLKSKGLCKKVECVDVSTKKGMKIAKQLGIDSVPSRVCTDSKGKLKKCSMKPIFKKLK